MSSASHSDKLYSDKLYRERQFIRRTTFVTAIAATLVVVLSLFYWFSARSDRLKELSRLYASGDLTITLSRIDELSQQRPLRAEELLIAAGCERQLGRIVESKKWLDRAQASGAGEQLVAGGRRLVDVQLGAFSESPFRLLRELEELGVDHEDAHQAAVLGFIVQGDHAAARTVLSQWEQVAGDSFRVLFARGVLQRASNLTDDALKSWKETIKLQPRFELAFLALAEVYTAPVTADMHRGKLVLVHTVAEFPNNTDAIVRLARLNRLQGAAEEAVGLLERPQMTEAMKLELAHVEFDRGHYAAAVRWLVEADLKTADEFINLTDRAFELTLRRQGAAGEPLNALATLGAMALAYAGDHVAARTVFQSTLERVGRVRRYIDLLSVQPIYPDDQGLAAAISAVSNLQQTAPIARPHLESDVLDAIEAMPGYRLYVEHCGACHGDSGDGVGSASRHLFPSPRSFRSEPFRIVSAANATATDADLNRVVRNGLPGASMPAQREMAESDLQLIISVVRAIQRWGLEEQFDLLAEISDGDYFDEVQREPWIARSLAPHAPLAIPEFTDATPAELDAGRDVYDRLGCAQCHSDPISLTPRLFDSRGRPILARNLQSDPFRGSREPQEVYKRLVLGMPGTPHPALSDTTEMEVASLIHFVLSLQTITPAETTNFQRHRRTLDP